MDVFEDSLSVPLCFQKKTNGKTKKNHKNKLVKRLHGLKNYESGSGCSKDE